MAGAAANTPVSDTASIHLVSSVVRIVSPISISFRTRVRLYLKAAPGNIGVFYRCLRSVLDIPGVFRQHDLLVAIAGGHHREAIFLSQYDHVEKEGTVISHARSQCGIELGGILDTCRPPAECSRQRHKVGQRSVIAMTV